MQDFAKYRRFERAELEEFEPEWSLDPISVLFGALMGAFVVFAGLKVSEYQEKQAITDQLVEEAAVEDSSLRFQFYTELKRDDLYPSFSEWISQTCLASKNTNS